MKSCEKCRTTNGYFLCAKKEAPFRNFFQKSDGRGSNPRSRPWQGRALPTTPPSHLFISVAVSLSTTIDTILEPGLKVKNFFQKIQSSNIRKIHFFLTYINVCESVQVIVK